MANFFFSVECSRGITLESIALVASDASDLYITDIGIRLAPIQQYESARKLQRWHITDLITRFIGDNVPSFIGYKPSYDWVALCELYGLGNLPAKWPHYCLDAYQRALMLGAETQPPINGVLNEARWLYNSWAMMDKMQFAQNKRV